MIETFPNPHPERDYDIRMRMPEFTCLCPKTGQPDFATLKLVYVPDQRCVELKSLKLYLWSMRDRGAFHEAITNEIAGQLIKVLEPRFLELEARFRRLARTLPRQRSQARGRALKPVASGANRAVQLAQLIAEHYLEAVQISDLAQTAGLNPNYAASLFKETFSMTMLEYLTQHRLAHAQRLLATTEKPILEIAFASGFGSASRFYAAFERATGLSPLKYRRGLRTG